MSTPKPHHTPQLARAIVVEPGLWSSAAYSLFVEQTFTFPFLTFCVGHKEGCAGPARPREKLVTDVTDEFIQ